MSGLELQEMMRDNQPSVPVKLIAAKDDESIETRAKASGADGFFASHWNSNECSNAFSELPIESRLSLREITCLNLEEVISAERNTTMTRRPQFATPP